MRNRKEETAKAVDVAGDARQRGLVKAVVGNRCGPWRRNPEARYESDDSGWRTRSCGAVGSARSKGPPSPCGPSVD